MPIRTHECIWIVHVETLTTLRVRYSELPNRRVSQGGIPFPSRTRLHRVRSFHEITVVAERLKVGKHLSSARQNPRVVVQIVFVINNFGFVFSTAHTRLILECQSDIVSDRTILTRVVPQPYHLKLDNLARALLWILSENVPYISLTVERNSVQQ